VTFVILIRLNKMLYECYELSSSLDDLSAYLALCCP